MFYSGGAWHRPQSTHAALLDKYWNKLQIGNMTREELKQASVYIVRCNIIPLLTFLLLREVFLLAVRQVLLSKYPNLGMVVDRLLDIYCQLTGDKHHAAVGGSGPQKPSEDRTALLEGRGLSLRCESKALFVVKFHAGLKTFMHCSAIVVVKLRHPFISTTPLAEVKYMMKGFFFFFLSIQCFTGCTETMWTNGGIVH